jgi:processive 1,2-diacylglycerol beta-glucosyltransferase
MPMTRILILHASIGMGHLRAAKALESAFRQRGVDHVEVEDVLESGNSLFGKLYAGSYIELAEKFPELWAYYYERSDRQRESQVSRRLGELITRMGLKGLDNLIAQHNPHAIICTHFVPLDLLLSYRRAGKLTQPIYCVVTDYTGHIFWVYPEIDGYFVGTAETARLLTERGVPESLISVTGIPVDPVIAEPKAPEQIQQQHGLSGEAVLTLLGSGIDTATVHQIVTSLLERDEIAGTLVVVAGRNETLSEALREMQSSTKLTLRLVEGFIDYMDDLVAASDVIITKAGGLIVSEVMARHTPLIIFDPVPGQEEWNADYVVSAGAGVQVRLASMVPVVAARLLHAPSYLHELRAGATRTGKPQAAYDIVDAVLGQAQASTAR